jgi:hypothetical protein
MKKQFPLPCTKVLVSVTLVQEEECSVCGVMLSNLAELFDEFDISHFNRAVSS